MTHPDPALSSRGLVRAFHERGLLSWGDVHAAQQAAFLFDETDDTVILAMALTVRTLRGGSVCLDLETASEWVFDADEQALEVPADLWPDVPAWLASLTASSMVASGPDAPTGRVLRLVDGLLYLERYWQEEVTVSTELRLRRSRVAPVRLDRLRSGLESLFDSGPSDQAQRLAAAMSVLSPVTVIAGGPGTGKTTTIARVIALLRQVATGPLRIAVAAPTGKAAARVEEALSDALAGLPDGHGFALAGLRATTLHRLLGWHRVPAAGSSTTAGIPFPMTS